MSNRLLFCTGEGIGNVIQTIPVIRTLRSMGYVVDMWHAFGSFNVPKLFSYVDKWVSGSEVKTLVYSNYIGLVSTYWTRNHINNIPLKNLANIYKFSLEDTEVNTYMNIARDLGVEEDSILWHGLCDYIPSELQFDVVIHNGFNPYGAANWRIKEYPHYEKVVKLLSDNGLSVCSIGVENEYIDGTVNMTGRNLPESFGIIKNAKIFLSNDIGAYHAANALEVSNVAIFTATSTIKNYDKRFHKFTTIIGRDDLSCRPCQSEQRWNNDCKDWECQNIDPQYVCDVIMGKLYGK